MHVIEHPITGKRTAGVREQPFLMQITCWLMRKVTPLPQPISSCSQAVPYARTHKQIIFCQQHLMIQAFTTYIPALSDMQMSNVVIQQNPMKSTHKPTLIILKG